MAGAAMYLGWSLPTTSSDSFVRSNWFPTNTALHAGRIFAVAPPMFPLGLILTDSLASRRGRLCSHPYPRGRRGLPATILHITCVTWACPDFPLLAELGAAALCRARLSHRAKEKQHYASKPRGRPSRYGRSGSAQASR